MSIHPLNMRRRPAAAGRATLIMTLLILAWSMQVRAAAPIQDHYFGATLFVVETGQVVWPPVAVNNLAAYESTYGRTSGPAVDHGYQAARLFFANGGESLYVIDPQGTQAQDFADALSASAGLPVDLVAIPGAACCSDSPVQHAAIMSALSQHVVASPNRFGLIDAPLDSDAAALHAYRAGFSSGHTAIYAPWLVLDGPGPGSSAVPPSSAVAGVISRIDREYGIYKTPAGPLAKLNAPPVADLQREFSVADGDALNADNVNLLRQFGSPAAIVVWGARTTKDVNARRYVAVARLLQHLKFSMDRSLATIFAKPPTAADVTTAETLIEDYLHGYWLQGALQGTSANQAYFVNCTFASPGLNCTVGVSPQRPAEFEVIQLAIAYGDLIFTSGFEVNEMANKLATRPEPGRFLQSVRVQSSKPSLNKVSLRAGPPTNRIDWATVGR